MSEVENAASLGPAIHEFIQHLFPICRSITGNGVRETLGRIQEHLPRLKITEVPTGEPAFDWEVPREWNISDAWIKDTSGHKIVDFNKSNLHVLNYSIPVRKRLGWEELKEHLFTLPEHPDWIPYRTSYYNENWGFCLSHSQFLKLDRNTKYDVCINSTLKAGSLTYGELLIPGQKDDEILISCHVCHPSLANDNLSGIAVATFLASWILENADVEISRMGRSSGGETHVSGSKNERNCLKKKTAPATSPASNHRYSYRFLFAPGTIGALTWLSRNQSSLNRIRHGLVLTCLGDSGPFRYKKSRRGDATIDRAMDYVLSDSGHDFELFDFSPDGYDERQYCSPGFNLPVGRLTRSCCGDYPEYHTSADDPSLVRPGCLADSLAILKSFVRLIEGNQRLLSLNPHGEPQLGKRGLYSSIGGVQNRNEVLNALLWVLNLADGQHTILDVARSSGIGLETIHEASELLREHHLVRFLDE